MSRVQPQERALVDDIASKCLVLVLLGVAAAGITETDIWGHFAIGLDTLKHGFLWSDPYSFTADQRWINHEWLWDVVTAAIFNLGGVPAILLLRSLLIGAVLWLVQRATAGMPLAGRLVTIGLVTTAAIGQWQSTRPQVATTTLYAITLANIEAPWLPLLFALWANIHGGWPFGLCAVACAALLRPTRRRLTLVVLCLLATLFNPYGIALWAALAEATHRGWTEVAEWAPIWSSATGPAILTVWIAVVTGTALASPFVKVPPSAKIWTALTLLIAARSTRMLALAAITSALLLLPGWEQSAVSGGLNWSRRGRLTAIGAFVFALAVTLNSLRESSHCFRPVDGWVAPEAEAVAYINASGLQGRAVVYFDFGEYVIFHLRDRLKVSIDNRRETVYSEKVVEQHLAFYEGRDPGYPMRLRADLVWLPAGSVAVPQLEAVGWYRRFEGPRTVILTTAAGPLTVGPSESRRPCFPYP